MPKSRHPRERHAHAILIVDDNDDTREALSLLLRLEGFTVAAASTGPNALDMLQAGLRPCVLLLDLRMPGMDGWTVIDRLQAHGELRQVPVVVLSGDEADRERAARVGVRELLRKPAEHTAIVAAVRRYCLEAG